jgi:hypothetical protein
MTICLSQIQPTAAKFDFWQYHGDFWASTLLGVIGLGLTIWAVVAAVGARTAANRAARIVRLQSVAIELMDIPKELDSFDDEQILFPAARVFLQKINFKLTRLIVPFQDYEDLGPLVTNIRETLSNAQTALNGVKPVPGAAPAPPGTVYNAIEGDLAILGGYVAHLLGLMHARSMYIAEPEGGTE